MLLIPCPWCGERYEGEFVALGERRPRRPDPAATSDTEWRAYLLERDNIRGEQVELWWHAKGCGERFAVVRDTQTHAIRPCNGPE